MWMGRRMTPDQVRQILEGAVGGHLQQQWMLFDIMEDTWPRLSKNLNELKRAAARTTFTVRPYAERGEDATDTATERADTVEAALRNWRPRPATLELSFESALYDALDAAGKGLSVLEVAWQRTPEGILPRCAHLLPISAYGWDDAGNELGLVGSATRHSSLDTRHSWQPFPEGQFWVGTWHGRSGAPGQTALLRSLAPYWCGITFGWEWLLNNAQIFGVPLRWATYDPNQPNLLPTLQAMLANIGQAGWAAFPQGTTMEFKEAVQRAADNPQVLIQAMADKACDLLILGQEASSESKPAGLGSGASDLHGAVRADRLQDAAQWVADLLNYQLVPAVLRWNFGDESEPPTIVPDFAGEPDPKAQADRDQVLAQIAPLPRKWFYERHGIPEPKEGEETVGGTPAFPQSLNPSFPSAFPPAGGPAVAGPSGVHTAPALAKPGQETEGTQKPENGADLPGGGDDTPSATKARRFNPRASAGYRSVAIRANDAGRNALPGNYQPPTSVTDSLAAAHARDLAPLRQEAEPLLAALQAGDLAVLGELEAFIARLDHLAPTIIGASALADALESALAQAAIAGAAGAYEKADKA